MVEPPHKGQDPGGTRPLICAKKKLQFLFRAIEMKEVLVTAL